jgi:hypothetical protein
MNTIFDYNMSKDYCSDWTHVHALRELAQNAIDSGQNYTCDYSDEEVRIVTRNATLPMAVFTLGVSQKSEGAIGKYGEGFKIAMLVLTREGLNPVIVSGNLRITGLFSPHEVTGVDTFKLVLTEEEIGLNTIDFTCSNSGVDLAQLAEEVTAFSDDPLAKTNTMDLLHDRIGFVYVNGLLVTKDSNLKFGYNISPDLIALNRDRRSISGLSWALGKLHAERASDSITLSLLYDLLIQGAYDVTDVRWFLSNKQKQWLADEFRNQYGDTGMQLMGSKGHGITVTNNLFGILQGNVEEIKTIDPGAPEQVLNQFVIDNRRFMRRDLRVRFDKLIEKSKGWSKCPTY